MQSATPCTTTKTSIANTPAPEAFGARQEWAGRPTLLAILLRRAGSLKTGHSDLSGWPGRRSPEADVIPVAVSVPHA